MKLAEDCVPSKVQELHMELAVNMQDGNAGSSAESIMAKARLLEKNHDYNQAIDAYLEMSKETTADMDYLERVWEDAAKLAMNHVHDRSTEVVSTASKRLVGIGRFEAAAELYEGIDAVKQAIDVYIAGGLWDKARDLGKRTPKLAKYVADMHVKQLMANEQADELVSSGNVREGLELYAQHGEWEKVHELAKNQGPDAAAKYSLKHAKFCLTSQKYGEAAAVLANHGIQAVPTPEMIELHKAVAAALIANSTSSDEGLEDLKKMLYKAVSAIKETGGNANGQLQILEKLHLIAHFALLRVQCKAKGLNDLAAKQAVTLLRYIGEIPVASAFYQAGALGSSLLFASR